jgi:SpoVK/Ycf46/Vps4 family AAA+-type ATPase
VSNKLIERGGTVFFGSVNPHSIMSFLADFSRVERDRKSIVILEDIDSLIVNFGEAAYLEMLDSAKTIDNVLFIATTNYPEMLDPRIYNRPGRFSHVIKIGLPTEKARKAYLEAILKKHDDVPFIVENTEGFTIDHLTALINSTYREKKELATEIKRLRTLFKMPKTGNQGKLGIGTEWENP